MARLRLFLAIEPTKKTKIIIKKILNFLQQQAGAEKIKWVPVCNLHITLHFIGTIEEKEVASLNNAINTALQNISSFTLEYKIQLQKFAGHQQIINIAVPKHPTLMQLAASFKEITAQLGIPTEAKPYVPHITLGREKNINFQLPEKLAAQIIKEEITSIALYQSNSNENGSVYTILNTYHLQKNSI